MAIKEVVQTATRAAGKAARTAAKAAVKERFIPSVINAATKFRQAGKLGKAGRAVAGSVKYAGRYTARAMASQAAADAEKHSMSEKQETERERLRSEASVARAKALAAWNGLMNAGADSVSSDQTSSTSGGPNFGTRWEG